jgi:hypothetical protein
METRRDRWLKHLQGENGKQKKWINPPTGRQTPDFYIQYLRVIDIISDLSGLGSD